MAHQPDHWARLSQMIRSVMTAANLPGLAIAVTDAAETLHRATFGLADITAGTPVGSQTLFQIGSISKSFTSIALLQLREAGRLDLDAPVDRYLPWFQAPSAFGPITVSHLMSHTGGLIRGSDMTPGSRYEAISLRDTTVPYAPGTHYHYSNVGYQALGYILEELSGQSSGQCVQERLLMPLHMTATQPVITHALRGMLAVGYRPLYDDRPSPAGPPRVPAPWIEYGEGDGSIASTADDMAAYVQLLLNRGRGPHGRILSEESFAALIEPLITIDAQTGYGRGLEVSQREGHTFIGHSGTMVGFHAVLLANLDRGVGTIVMTNAVDGYDEAQALLSLLSDIAHFALEMATALRAATTLPPAPVVADRVVIDDAAQYAGTYHGTGRTLEVVAEGRHLVLQHGGGRVQLERHGPDAFYANHPDFALFLVRFERRDGQIVSVSHGPDRYHAAQEERLSDGDPPALWRAYPGHYRSHDPWTSNFRVVLRGEALLLIYPWSDEYRLVPLAEGLFRVGEDETEPERLQFDTIVGGHAYRARLSQNPYYRFFTP